MEPTSFKVKAKSQFKGDVPNFQPTKLMTRLAVLLEVGANGSLKFEVKDGIDYAAVSQILVPSYKGISFLDPKGYGGSQGYHNGVAIPIGGADGEEELAKEKP
ncbi:hypothetical protein L7F22_013821 [Adiantum nelumboides]|nr:hypothetical protein [Adiantum nelumboides]